MKRHRMVYVPILRKSLPLENKKHLDRVRALPCSVTGIVGATEAHHPKGNGWGCGMGMKAPDETAIPLCQSIHAEYHRIGVKSWEAKYGAHEMHLKKTLTLLEEVGV